MIILLCITTFLIPFYFIRFSIGSIPTNVFEVAVATSLIVQSFNCSIVKINSKSKIRNNNLTTRLAEDSPRRIKQLSNSSEFFVNNRIFFIFTLIILVAVVLGVYKAGFSREALGIAKGWFLVPIVYFYLIVQNFDRRNVSLLAVPTYFSLMIVSLWAFAQKLGLVTTLFYQKSDQSFIQYLTGNFRVFGPFESPNYLAMFLVPMFFLSLPIFNLIKNKTNKVFIAILYSLPLVALILSGSRAGIIAFIVAVFIYIFTTQQKNIGSMVLSSALLVSVAFFAVIFFYQYGLNPTSDSVRIEIYHYAIKILKGNWLWGIGLGNFKDVVTEYSIDALSFKTHALPYAIHPHNIFLAFWLNLGLLGFLSFVSFVIYLFYSLFKSTNRSLLFVSAFCALVAILIHGLFDTTYFKNDLSVIFWLTAAMIFILSNEKRKKV